MAVPTEDQLVTAVQDLARPLFGPGRDHGRSATGTTGVAEVAAGATRVAYRLLLVGLARQRGAEIAVERAVAGLDTGPLRRDLDRWEVVASGWARGLPSTDDVVRLGDLHQRMLRRTPVGGDGLRLPVAGDRRKRAGAWFSPRPLVARLVVEAIGQVPGSAGELPTVCDPACGAGIFLLEAADRLVARQVDRGVDERTARLQVLATAVHGVDVDPQAVELTRVCLWLSLARDGEQLPLPGLRLAVGDALAGAPVTVADVASWRAEHGLPEPGFDWRRCCPDVFDRGGFDAVVGNPPFLNQLGRSSAATAPQRAARAAHAPGVIGPYTDVSAVFLHRASTWVREGGTVGLVQPTSLLAARDAGGVRRDLARTCALEWLWGAEEPLFDANVRTCAVVLRRGAPQGPVRRSSGRDLVDLPPRSATPEELGGEWAFLLAPVFGVPELVLPSGSGVVGDLASVTADFRDQYYGLTPHVRERADGTGRTAPLVTSGLIDPGECRWGRTPTRFAKQAWDAPVVDLDSLAGAPALARWAESRLLPKVLVATQGRVVEAVVDEHGRWLPSVPVITVTADRRDLWRLLAVLLAPPVTAHALHRYAGTALSTQAVKLSARQVAALPLPAGSAEWDRAAVLVREAQQAGGASVRRERLVEAGTAMCRAYGAGPDVLRWWTDRLRRR